MLGFVDIRPAERRPALGAFLGLLGITAGHTLLETARDALFLAKLPAARLPWMYMAIAAIGLALAQLRRPKGRSATGSEGKTAVVRSLLLAATIDVGFWVASSWKGTWFLYALYVWTGIFASWVIVQFWLLLGQSFTVGQAKRIFGFIGAGSVLGAVGGAALARTLAGFLPAQHLLLGAAATLVVTALGPVLLLRAEPASEVTAASAARASLRADLKLVGRDPYVKRILLLTLLSTVALTTVDFLFKYAVVARKAPAELAAYFADVYLVFNSIALVVQVGLVGWALRTLGLHRALWALPVLLATGAAGVIAGGGLVAALLLKGVDGALRHSLHKTSAELLYLPLPDATRARAKPFIDLVGQRGGQALASIGILGLMALAVPADKEKALAVVVAVLVTAWIGVALTIRGHYLEVFRATLRDGKMDYRGDLPALDLGALETLFLALNSSKDAEVIGALDMLAAQSRQRLIPALVLYHPSKSVVLRALEIFTAERRNDFLPIADRLLSHADVEVRAAALRARIAVEPDPDFLRARLNDEQLELRATALVSLLSRGWMVGAEAETSLRALREDASPAVRVALAQAIGCVAGGTVGDDDDGPQVPRDLGGRFEETLLELAMSPEPEVCTEVAIAMGRLGSERFLPILAAWIARREEGAAAREALAAIGAPALAHLAGQVDDRSLPLNVRWALPRAIALFDPLKATAVLLPLLERSEGMMRFRILRALSKLRADDPDLELDAGVLGRAAEDTARAAFRLLDWRCSLLAGTAENPQRATPAHELLVTMLRDKEAHALGRLFRLLGLLHPHENFERIHRGLLKSSAKTRASSRELVENVVEPPLRNAILTLIDELPDEERLARAAPWYRRAGVSYEETMRTLLARGGETASVASYHAAEIGLRVTARPPAVDVGAKTVLAAALDEQKRAKGVAHAP
jgi:AAA family ATP:ADP antiporter